MKTTLLSGTARLVPLLLSCGLIGSSSLADARPITSRHLERPAAQKSVPSSSSYVERTVSLASAGFIEVEFFVDSEEGQDFLDIEVDGQVAFRASGEDRGGTVTLPLAAGSHHLRFIYSKDGQTSVGEDTAWVSRLKVLQNGAVVETQAFGESKLGTADGWQGGGTSGGFTVASAVRKRSFRRPTNGAFLGYQPGHVVSSAQRSFEWPVGSRNNELLVSYYVDSEHQFDYLRIYVDGVERFAISGADQTGRQRIDVGSAGTHTVEIAYDKDPSFDYGSDDARVLELQAASEFGTVQFGGFEAAELGSTPSGWQVGAHATDGRTFSVGHDPAARLYAELVDPASTAEPTVDGVIDGDYENQSISKLPNLAVSNAKPGEFWLSTLASGKRFLALRMPKGAGGAAALTLMTDQGRASTLAGTGCGQPGAAPDGNDRKVEIQFSASLGDATSVAQTKGSCLTGTNAWVPLADDEDWLVDASASEPPEDPGFVHVEVSLMPIATVLLEDWGLGLIWQGGGFGANLPRVEGMEPLLDDAASWETIRYAPTLELGRLSFITVDGQSRRRAN